MRGTFASLLFPLAVLQIISSAAQPSRTNPCARITSRLNRVDKERPFFFDSGLGLKCLQSSTFDNQLASAFLEEYGKYLEFQTTLSYLKNPPAEHPYPATDLVAGLNNLKRRVSSQSFSSQYAFEIALTELINTAHEGHLGPPSCVSPAIQFQRQVSLVSVSEDGVKLPQVFVLEGAEKNTPNIRKLKVSQSNVVKINGQDVVKFLERDALQSLSDPDSAYNLEFWNFGQKLAKLSAYGMFTESMPLYPETETSITFSNGTNTVVQTRAIIANPKEWSSKITNGASLFSYFCIDAVESAQQSQSAAEAAASSLPPSPRCNVPPSANESQVNLGPVPGYPDTPVVKDPYNHIAGYFLNGSSYQDVAVLHVGSFAHGILIEPSDEARAAQTFQQATSCFIAAARASRKSKVIIDLICNSGGSVLAAYDLFTQFFPSIEPIGATRLRGNAASQLYMKVIGDTKDPIVQDRPLEWNFRTSLTTNLSNFSSLDGSDGFYPPVIVNGDNFTSLTRRNLNNSRDDCLTGALVPSGFGNNSRTSPQPFETTNVVILTDGVCASACSIFTEFMTRQAQVKTVVIGGRPHVQPSQAIGGTKGAEFGEFALIQQVSQSIMIDNHLSPEQVALANSSFPGLHPLPFVSDFAKLGVNLRDNIPPGDDQQIPLQFVFEPADCRIFYTPQSVTQPREVWKQVADTMWGNKTCAWGNLKGPALLPRNGNAPTNSPCGSDLAFSVTKTGSAIVSTSSLAQVSTQPSVLTAFVAVASGSSASNATPKLSRSKSGRSAAVLTFAFAATFVGLTVAAVGQLVATSFWY
ncbi:MAG: hypothetical protein Q9165_005962 [Trypethelium subeluteriae]